MEVIYIAFELKSFQWNNGLYIIVKETDTEYEMCKLVNGKPQLNDDGRFMISITGKGNKGISKTNLIYKN